VTFIAIDSVLGLHPAGSSPWLAMVLVARCGEQALALRPASLALHGLLGLRQGSSTRAHNASLRFGVLDWAAPPIVLLGLPVLRLQHQAPRVVRCSATLDLFVRGGRLARLIRRPSCCVGPARPCRYERVMSALLCLPLGRLVCGDILLGLQMWDWGWCRD